MTNNIDPSSLGPIQGPTAEPLVTPAQTGQQAPQDTIQAADEIASIVYLYSAAMPTLQPPNYDSSIDITAAVAGGVTAEMASKLFNRMDEINKEVVNDMLDSWLKTIEEQAQHVKDWIASPQYQHFIESRFPNQRPESVINLERTRAAGVEATANYSKAESDPTTAAFLAGSLVLGAGMIIDFVPTVGGEATQVSIAGKPNVVGEAMPAFQNVVNDPNLVAQLGYIGGMIAAGAAHSAVLTSIIGAVERGGKPNSAQTFRGFAQRVLNLVQNPDFSQHILFRVVDRMPGAEKMSEAVKNQMIAIVKTILLATSLAALYKGETKWLGEEVTNLLKGDLSGFFTGGTKEDRALRGNIGAELQAVFAVLSEEQKTRLLDALGKYFKSQPSMQQLTDIGQTFDNITAQITQSEIAG